MNTFLLHWNGSGPTGCVVCRFEDRKTAETYSYECLPGDRIAYVVADLSDLSDRRLFNGPVLVTIFNALTNNDPGVKKFESLEHARERVLRVLNERFGEQPFTELVTPPAPTVDPKKEKRMKANGEKAPKAPKAPKTPRAAPSPDAVRITDEQVIQSFVANPKRAGTAVYDNYEKLRKGMTVAAFVAAGGDRSKLWWEVKCGRVTLSS